MSTWGGHESRTGQAPSRKLKVTLLSSEWKSTKGGLSTLNRELAIQLAKHQNVEVSMYLPWCSEEDLRIAKENHIKLIQAKELIGFEPIEWLLSAPENHEIDYVIGHGLILGRQVQLIKKQVKCKWIQIVHTAPEDLGMFKEYANAISRAEKKHNAEIQLCELADQVVAVGPKLADEYKCYLRYSKRDQSVFVLTPSIFCEFSLVKQAAEEREKFRVLVFGRGNTEDFKLKGYDVAAKAFSKLKKRYQLVFVGAPLGREEEVAEKLCKHGIARSQLTVRSFKESREDLVRLFCEVDLCIMPSRTEGFGLAALEALSAGLPILVSGNSGLGDALEHVPHGSSCVLYSEDPRQWAKAIKSVRKKRRDVRLKETEHLRIQYAEEYSWEKQCGELVRRMLDSVFASNSTTESLLDSAQDNHALSLTSESSDGKPGRKGEDGGHERKRFRSISIREALFRKLSITKDRTYQTLPAKDPDRPQDYEARYDVFISYSSKDVTWVKRLLAELEKRRFTCCVDFRDFVRGTAVAENIYQAIYYSRKTIAVLSPAFAKSGWCNHELQQALTTIRSHQVVPIVYRKCAIPLTLQDRTFLDWESCDVKSHFWEQLETALKHPSDEGMELARSGQLVSLT
ncbi:uncharacterized protein [Montipora foliosa]|uniref:uncharacterized protein isoform X2 n=1 Tax=Montipora foliosa TaxID=591990 RepID=UPI0035F17267